MDLSHISFCCENCFRLAKKHVGEEGRKPPLKRSHTMQPICNALLFPTRYPIIPSRVCCAASRSLSGAAPGSRRSRGAGAPTDPPGPAEPKRCRVPGPQRQQPGTIRAFLPRARARAEAAPSRRCQEGTAPRDELPCPGSCPASLRASGGFAEEPEPRRSGLGSSSEPRH